MYHAILILLTPAPLCDVDLSVQAFLDVLAQPVVDMETLRTFCWHGVPSCNDVKGIRSLCWMLLLGYLPPERAQWAGEQGREREEWDAVMLRLLYVCAGTAMLLRSCQTHVTLARHEPQFYPQSALAAPVTMSAMVSLAIYQDSSH